MAGMKSLKKRRRIQVIVAAALALRDRRRVIRYPEERPIIG